MDRKGLQTVLTTILPRVYYQPPSSIKLVYPCITYARTDIRTTRANNNLYLTNTQYTIMVITKDADDPTPMEILKRFPSSSYNRDYIADNLYHTLIDVYI